MNNKINIFLDDIRQPEFIQGALGDNYPNNWIITRNYQDFCLNIDSNLENIGLVSFDHDIDSYDEQNKELTGKDAAKYLIERCLDNNIKLPNFYVHSMNPIGSQSILTLLFNYLNKVEGITLDSKYFHLGLINGKLI